MKLTITHLTLVAALSLAAVSCDSAGAVTVNPEDGTVYLRAKGSKQLRVCKTGEKCVDGGEMTIAAIDMEYVGGVLWVVDGKEVRSCTLDGACAGTISTQLNKPVSLAATGDGRVFIISRSGKLAECDTNGSCRLVK